MDDGAHVRLRDGRVVEGRPHALREFQATLGVSHNLGVTPLIVSPTPGHGVDVGRCLKKTAQLGLSPERCAFPRAAAQDMQRHIFDFLREVEKTAPVVWLFDAVCDQTRCDAARRDVLLYHDYGHLTPEGSVYVGKAVDLGRRLLQAPR